MTVAMTEPLMLPMPPRTTYTRIMMDMLYPKFLGCAVRVVDLGKMDIMAPVNSHRLEYQNHNTRAKVLDFSSGNPNHKVFAMFIPDEKELYKVLLEPDAQLLENIQKSCPRKVFLD